VGTGVSVGSAGGGFVGRKGDTSGERAGVLVGCGLAVTLTQGEEDGSGDAIAPSPTRADEVASVVGDATADGPGDSRASWMTYDVGDGPAHPRATQARRTSDPTTPNSVRTVPRPSIGTLGRLAVWEPVGPV
jgi:hypothetical protein